MKKQRLMLFSGFLGSGKTTTMVATAKYLRERGIKAALVTNDLGQNLVDTGYAQLSGVPVAEIPNGCLCHDVPHFVETLHRVMEQEDPDIIFAEPVGSCIGLVENVYCEMDSNFADTFELAPFVALVDPNRYESIYMHPENNTFDDEATYLYRAQLDDADTIVINKCDLISEEKLAEVKASLHSNFPHATIVAISAREGKGFDAWVDTFAEGSRPSLHKANIDWDYLLSGDAHMGWYNKMFELESAQPLDLDQFCLDFTAAIGEIFRNNHIEIAHFKVLGSADGGFSKAALTSAQQEAALSDKLGKPVPHAQVNVNMRALASPEKISDLIGNALRHTADKLQVKLTAQQVQAFDSFSEAPAPVCD